MHQTYVYNIALRATGCPVEAQDIAQEAFLRAWKALPGFKMQSGFGTWIYRIVVNLCYNRYPGLKREMNQLPVEETENLAQDDSPSDPVLETEARQLRQFLHEQIASLPPGYRLLILLRYQQGLSYEEISQIASMPLGSVKTGLFRAHALLRKALTASKEAEYAPMG